jgi:hypothetical protein
VKYDASVVAEAKYTIDLSALPSGDWNFHKFGTRINYDERLALLSNKELNKANLTELEKASRKLTIRLKIINEKLLSRG